MPSLVPFSSIKAMHSKAILGTLSILFRVLFDRARTAAKGIPKIVLAMLWWWPLVVEFMLPDGDGVYGFDKQNDGLVVFVFFFIV